MSNVMQWDELTILRQEASKFFSTKRKKQDIDRFCDYLEFVLCLVYVYGWKDAEEIIGTVPLPDGFDDKAVNLDIDGKTFRDRVTEDTTPEEIMRLIDTEAHRDYNTGIQDAASTSGRKDIRKTWHTMMDDKVRDTHDYLEGITIPIEDKFVTYDGDEARFPGDFSDPSNVINCRCELSYS